MAGEQTEGVREQKAKGQRTKKGFRGQGSGVNVSKLQEAREKSWETFGKKLTFYVPGMIRCDGFTGRYQALSITGGECALQCEHCRGELLRTMLPATTPRALAHSSLQHVRAALGASALPVGKKAGGSSS